MPDPSDLTKEIQWPKRVKTPGEAVRFIDAAGFCLLFPVKNVPLPSLYYAMARHMPITWDKYAKKLWGWKDNFPRRQRVFYAKYFKSRGTFISLKILPHFLAMRETTAGPEDYERFYAAGRIHHEARAIWEALADHGPLATLELRHACKMASKAGNVRFKKAMNDLQCLLIATHFGAEQETAAWASGRFALTACAFPRQVEQARAITPESARATLARKYLEWHSGAPPMTLARLFGWSKAEAVAATAAT
ncbi:MAG TPA: crosslink repair DNA glycosylase YcaQ family protein [Candidatus Acidoferrales bacterium]|nr:crosslink repair DNA glycosylase YcaQ family protein [Candidatus Acidoferrales bacterium]